MVALPADADISLALEAAIDQLARVARSDPGARDALYGIFRLKIARFIVPLQHRFSTMGDRGDLDHEGYLAFVQLLDDWHRRGANGTFPAYFLGFMRWRLRHRVEWYERRVRLLVPLDLEFVSRIALGGGGCTDVDAAAAT